MQQIKLQGADRAILKTEPTDKLIQAIRDVAQGGTWVSQSLWHKIRQPQTLPIDFAEADKAWLALIVTEMTIEDMAVVLHLSENTLKRRLQEIYTQLGVTTLRGAAIKIVRLGLA